MARPFSQHPFSVGKNQPQFFARPLRIQRGMPGQVLDRAFIDAVVTSTLVFEGNGVVREYVGGYEDWLRHKTAAEKEAAKAASPRIPIDTPTLSGSVSLKSGSVDDLLLKRYRQTTDKASPPVELLDAPEVVAPQPGLAVNDAVGQPAQALREATAVARAEPAALERAQGATGQRVARAGDDLQQECRLVAGSSACIKKGAVRVGRGESVAGDAHCLIPRCATEV